MEKIKIDVLVIGALKVESCCSYWELDGINALGCVSVGRNECPQEIRSGERVFDVSDAIVIRANDNVSMDIDSLVVPKGRRILATGYVAAFGRFTDGITFKQI